MSGYEYAASRGRGHHRTVCALCASVVSSCRCIGPHETTFVEKCPRCIRGERTAANVRDQLVERIRKAIADARESRMEVRLVRVSGPQWDALGGLTEIDGVQIVPRGSTIDL